MQAFGHDKWGSTAPTININCSLYEQHHPLGDKVYDDALPFGMYSDSETWVSELILKSIFRQHW